MTRQTPEENILKCTSELAETKAFENLSNPIDNSLLLHNLPTNSEIEQETKLSQLKRDLTITQSLVKQPMTKLYDLEKKENPISSTKIDLDIDLYQMEDY
ncbi:MAG: hypothetical protein NWF10_08525 [Candidatus Bathyarchaeota archaeon]|nr:hypothetical protein [Candidatus Bathyarchaeota archaeon]